MRHCFESLHHTLQLKGDQWISGTHRPQERHGVQHARMDEEAIVEHIGWPRGVTGVVKGRRQIVDAVLRRGSFQQVSSPFQIYAYVRRRQSRPRGIYIPSRATPLPCTPAGAEGQGARLT